MTESYVDKIKKIFPDGLDVIFLKGFTLWNAFFGPPKQQHHVLGMLSFLQQEVLKPGGYIIIAPERDHFIADYFIEHLGYLDVYARNGSWRVAGEVLRQDFLCDGNKEEDKANLYDGSLQVCLNKVGIRVIQKPHEVDTQRGFRWSVLANLRVVVSDYESFLNSDRSSGKKEILLDSIAAFGNLYDKMPFANTLIQNRAIDVFWSCAKWLSLEHRSEQSAGQKKEALFFAAQTHLALLKILFSTDIAAFAIGSENFPRVNSDENLYPRVVTNKNCLLVRVFTEKVTDVPFAESVKIDLPQALTLISPTKFKEDSLPRFRDDQSQIASAYREIVRPWELTIGYFLVIGISDLVTLRSNHPKMLGPSLHEYLHSAGVSS